MDLFDRDDPLKEALRALSSNPEPLKDEPVEEQEPSEVDMEAAAIEESLTLEELILD